MELNITILIIVLAIFFEGFFSGNELAIISLNRLWLKYYIEEGHSWAKKVSYFLNDPSKLLGTTLLGTNFSVVLASTTLTIYIIMKYGARYEYFSLIILSPLILIFGEVLPKTFYKKNAYFLLPKTIFPLWIISKIIFFPFVYVLSKTSKFVLSTTGLTSTKIDPLITKEELKLILKAEDGLPDVKTHEKTMIDKILAFSQIQCKDVMIPLIEVFALNISTTVDSAIKAINEKGYSKVPIYANRIDNILGVIYSLDLLFSTRNDRSIKKFIRSANFVPLSLPVDELLGRMQKEGLNIVIVVDEYGGAVGIITIEDILEEIVGEIHDEYDVSESLYKKIGANEYIINARSEIDKLNEALHLNIPKGEFETIGGFLICELKRIPQPGETIKYKNMTFVIRKATDRMIYEVLLKLA